MPGPLMGASARRRKYADGWNYNSHACRSLYSTDSRRVMNLITLDFEKVLPRLLAKVVQDKTGCWLWQSSKDKRGYGHFYVKKNGKSFMARAHVISYMLFKGGIPVGHIIRHTCDIPACVNPLHLLSGTQKDNMRDRDERGRRKPPKGSMNGRAQLTAAQALDIKQSSLSNVKLSKIYPASPTQIQRIKAGKSWGHL